MRRGVIGCVLMCLVLYGCITPSLPLTVYKPYPQIKSLGESLSKFCYHIDEFVDLPSFGGQDFLAWRNQHVINYYNNLKKGITGEWLTLAQLDQLYSKYTGEPIPSYPRKPCITTRYEDNREYYERNPDNSGLEDYQEIDPLQQRKGYIDLSDFDIRSNKVIRNALYDILPNSEETNYTNTIINGAAYVVEWDKGEFESMLIHNRNQIRFSYVSEKLGYGSMYSDIDQQKNLEE